MNQNKNLLTPPRRNQLPIIQKLVAAYKLWQEILLDFPKISRYTLGTKIDSLLLESMEEILSAGALNPAERLIKIKKAIKKFNSAKFLLQIAWEIKSLSNKKYIVLSEKLEEIGRMLGGWLKILVEKTSPK